eukprot:5543210-Prymnesium_polylepis.1
MASEGLRGTGAGKRGEGCSGAGSKAKRAWRPTISMRFSTRRSSGLLAQCVYHPAAALQCRWPAPS